jgi:hypothetical protein
MLRYGIQVAVVVVWDEHQWLGPGARWRVRTAYGDLEHSQNVRTLPWVHYIKQSLTKAISERAHFTAFISARSLLQGSSSWKPVCRALICDSHLLTRSVAMGLYATTCIAPLRKAVQQALNFISS